MLCSAGDGLLTSAGFPHAVNWHWRHQLVIVVVGCSYAVASGWIVGWVHRTNRLAAVFGFLFSVLIVSVLELPLLYWFAPRSFSRPWFPFLR